MTSSTAPWSLDDLSREVTALLRAAGLLASQGDARVSAAPDARTVRYYATLGLLDRPALEGRAARYRRKHLLQLVAIKALQAEGLTLGQIQARLYGRSEAELEQLAGLLVARARAVPPPLPPLRALTEVTLSPGLKLVAEEGFAGAGEDRMQELERQFRAALAAIAHARTGRGEKP